MQKMHEERKNFLVILDLSRFFCDHRRVARVFIKKHIKTIKDLQCRISELFGINGFYLTTGDHFLHQSEDIRVLNNGETISVNPQNSNTSRQNAGKMPFTLISTLSKMLGSIPEESNTPSDNKNNKKTAVNGLAENKIPSKKIKVSHSISIENCNTLTSVIDEKPNENAQNETQHSAKEKNNKAKEFGFVENEICNIEAAQKISEIKDNLKRKIDNRIEKSSSSTPKKSSEHVPHKDYKCSTTPVKSTEQVSCFKTVLPKLQNHIKNCNNFGRSTVPDSVRLSRHVDTPFKKYSEYIAPQRITNKYLSKVKTNIVKIDRVIDNSEKCSTDLPNTGHKITNITSYIVKDATSPPENYVETVVNSFEKQASPKDESDRNIKKEFNGVLETDLEQKRNDSCTKSDSEQKNTNTSKTDVTEINENSPIDFLTLYNIETGQANITFENLNLNQPLEEDHHSTEISLDISSIPQNSVSSLTSDSGLNVSNISTESKNNAAVVSKKINLNKLPTGVGLLLEQLRESDSIVSQESDSSNQYVTKRKRIRKRRSKKNDRKESESQTEAKECVPNHLPKSCPKMHIKFEDNDIDKIEGEVDLTLDDASQTSKYETCQSKIEDNAEKLSVIETVVLSDENEDPVMENKDIFGSDNILKAPLMEDKLEPKEGDVIAFKILKIGENYSPQISNFIIGKVDTYISNNKTVYFKILSGNEELLPVVGKLSLTTSGSEDIQNSKYKEIAWKEVLEPKLLFP